MVQSICLFMKTLQFIILCLLLGQRSYCQMTISGKIFDAETKEALAGVTIFDPGTQNGAVSNNNGCFTLTTTSGIDSLQIRFIGYSTSHIKTNLKENMLIALMPLANSMQEVVVTANRDVRLRSDAPMAIEKLSATTINDTKPTLLAELINKVPGVVMMNLNNEQHGMAIRQPMGTSPYYLYMEDGIPLRTMGVFNHNALIEMNLFSISSIEVVKGPASSLYGPEAVGGAMNFISQKPTALTTAKLGVQMDNYGYKRLQYGTGGMATKKLGYFVGGYYASQKNGWMSYSDYDKNSVNARLDYDLTKKTKLILAGTYNNYYSQTPGSVDSTAFYQRTYLSPSQFTYRKVIALRTRFSIEHKWNQNNNTTLHLFYRNNTIEQNPSYAIKWTKGSSTATGEVNDNSFYSRGFIAQHVYQLPSLKTKIIGGVSLDNSPVKYSAYRTDLSTVLRPGGNSVEQYNIVAERPEIALVNYKAHIINSAAYLQAEIAPLKNLLVTLGGRYDNMQFTYVNFLDNSSGNKTYQKYTPKIGVTYKLKSHAGFYANYSLGFSPPGLTNIFTKKPGTSNEFYYNLEPAEFTNYEAGGWLNIVKEKLNLNATVYQMNGKNELLNVKLPDNSTDYQSAGKTVHRGIEYNLVYRPDKQWMIRAGGTNAVHRYEEFVLSTKSTDLIKDVNGKIMPSAPSWIINSEIIFKPSFVKGLRVGIEWQHLSSWYQNQVNTIKYEDKGAFGMKGISVLNFRIGYQWKSIELFSNIMNLSNELYAYNATRGNSSTNTSTYTPAPPRTFVFGLQYNFTQKSK